jgi:hypothetical protein
MRNCNVRIEHGRDMFCILFGHFTAMLVINFFNKFYVSVPFCKYSISTVHSILDKHEKYFNQVRSHLCAVHIYILGKDLLATCIMYSDEELH